MWNRLGNWENIVNMYEDSAQAGSVSMGVKGPEYRGCSVNTYPVDGRQWLGTEVVRQVSVSQEEGHAWTQAELAKKTEQEKSPPPSARFPSTRPLNQRDRSERQGAKLMDLKLKRMTSTCNLGSDINLAAEIMAGFKIKTHHSTMVWDATFEGIRARPDWAFPPPWPPTSLFVCVYF